MEAQTVRQIIRTSIGGSSVRIRLSNLFGTKPVTIGPLHVAKHATGSAIQPGTDHAVTFGGKPTVTIAPGGDALSDPVAFSVAALEELAVSLYVPARTGPSTIHGTAIQTAFISRTGDTTAATIFPAGETDGSRFFLTDVEVAGSADARAIVIVGDSITDGVGSTRDHNVRWPDALAQRLQATAALASIAVVNSGMSGNRILNDGVEPFVGPSVLSRFDRDALSKPGVHWILLLAGINDISAADALAAPRDNVSAQQIIDGMKMLIARAHDKGIKIWGGTLTPFKGVEAPFYFGGWVRQSVRRSTRGSAPPACSTRSSISSRRLATPHTRIASCPRSTMAIICTQTMPGTKRWRQRSIWVGSQGTADRRRRDTQLKAMDVPMLPP